MSKASNWALVAAAGEIPETVRWSFWAGALALFLAIGLAFLIALFNQLSGINAIIYFAPVMIFLGFAGMMVLQLAWVRFAMIETLGRSLEEVAAELAPSIRSN